MNNPIARDFPPVFAPEFSAIRNSPDEVEFRFRFHLPRPAFTLCYLPIARDGHPDFQPGGLFHRMFHGYADCLDTSDRLAIVMADSVESRTVEEWQRRGDLDDCCSRALAAAHIQPARRLHEGFGEFTRHLGDSPACGFIVLGNERGLAPTDRDLVEIWMHRMQKLSLSGKIMRIRGNDSTAYGHLPPTRFMELDISLRDEAHASGRWLAARVHSRLLPYLAARVEIAAGHIGGFRRHTVFPDPPRYRSDKPDSEPIFKHSRGGGDIAIRTVAVAGVQTTVQARMTPHVEEKELFERDQPRGDHFLLRIADPHFLRSGPPRQEPAWDDLIAFESKLSPL